MATQSSTFAWKTHEWRNLAGYSPWGCKESDMTERLSLNSCEISQRKEDKKPCSQFAKFNQKSPLSF